MRPALPLLVVVVLSSCFGGAVSQGSECAAFASCQRALDTAAGETTNLDRFDEGGYCWHNRTLAEGCTTACVRALERLRARASSLPQECQP
ncbi:MAG: hypothetical protein ACOZQL_21005 [Myxococcota bacterium]